MAEAPAPTPAADAALRFSRASVGYAGRTVLHGVDLRVEPGQALALVGPNGAGKSTLIKAVLGMAQLLGGSLTILGHPPAGARGLAAYVPQVDSLDADFPVSAGQVVLMGRYRHSGWLRPPGRADRRIAAEALARVGLADRARDRFGLLSGGQRQRVLLARAIAAQPRLLLLDEPFNGLDAPSQEEILRVLADLRAEGTALVVSTHDLTIARDACDTVCLLNGRQYAFGPAERTLSPALLRETYGSQAVELPGGRTVLVEP
ncbi:manganese/iron transport system ATP-binding protein [Micromonospora pisi]|uniref:Manganese/iron transport system ATP-binding protein n=1 Tax=Micromonospora pisi TaxID=589240 RepID=A0A495JT73_9ACTN|nr:ABC transporter ATP-binding protein [Micromonospora pisi]RKR91738.1 manganese/iron transport system ATP-binding protein [Micromonospora pisi]